jgi:hypothetical protein
MLKPLLLAGLAAAAFIPSLASAQDSCREAQHDNRVAGTIVGAGVGALLGGAITGHTGGAVVGGVGGAVAGNVIAGSGTRCGENRYGYYDSAGRWVPTTSTAYGYYDHDGQWVASSSASYGSESGYSQNGYNRGDQNGYDRNSQNNYNQGSQYGHDRNSQNAYDRNGYDRHQAYATTPAPAYGRDANYSAGRMNFSEREDRLDQRIHEAMSNGSLDYREGRRDLRELADIRRVQGDYRSGDGRMDGGQRADIDRRLDDLQSRLHMQDAQR